MCLTAIQFDEGALNQNRVNVLEQFTCPDEDLQLRSLHVNLQQRWSMQVSQMHKAVKALSRHRLTLDDAAPWEEPLLHVRTR